jgi:hypothetical protein
MFQKVETYKLLFEFLCGHGSTNKLKSRLKPPNLLSPQDIFPRHCAL